MRGNLKVKDFLQLCKIGSKLPKLDFAGSLSILVGADVTKAGIPYTCLVHSRMPYVNAYVPPGILGLAQAVLSCIDWRPARFFIGAGQEGSMLELCRLKASGNVHYVGLQSLSALPVRGIVGESVVLELLKEVKERNGDSDLKGRNARRPTYVVLAEITKPNNIKGELLIDKEEGALLNYFAIIVCVTALVLMGRCHGWFGFALVAIGMFLNAVMAFLLQEQKFELPEANPAEGAPPGDAVIQLSNELDVFCVLRGPEKAIQILLQKEVKLNAGWVERWPLFLVALACQIYSAVVMLGVPHMNSSAQYMFACVVIIGGFVDLIKGTFDCKREIARDAIIKYGIEKLDVKKFGNRTAAVASIAAGNTKLDTLKAAELLPTAGIIWKNWWTALGNILEDDKSTEVQKKLEHLDATVPEQDKTIWKTLKDDMYDGLKLGGNRKLRKRVGILSKSGDAQT